jgi:hypothetical protein
MRSTAVEAIRTSADIARPFRGERSLVRRKEPIENDKGPHLRAFSKRLKGLEPSTFCMATSPIAVL